VEKPNRQIIAEMREMLTQWFPEELREQTKPWRSHMWKLLNEAEERMCPVDVREKRLKRGSTKDET
jgi:hypothetical protein